ncbi:phage portal protein [Roseibium salinum]|nr:phage portal protein [Roseibium salinum]
MGLLCHRPEQSALVDRPRGFFEGAPDQSDEPWIALADALARKYPGAGGLERSIDLSGVDSGWATQRVYRFFAPAARTSTRSTAVKKQAVAWLGTPTSQAIVDEYKRKIARVQLYPVNAYDVKTEVMAGLANFVQGKDANGRWPRNTFQIAADLCDEELALELTAERLVDPEEELRKAVNRRARDLISPKAKKEWKKIGGRKKTTGSTSRSTPSRSLGTWKRNCGSLRSVGPSCCSMFTASRRRPISSRSRQKIRSTRKNSRKCHWLNFPGPSTNRKSCAHRFLSSRGKTGSADGRAVPGAGYLRNTGSGPAVFMAGPALRDISDDIRQAWTPAAARTIEALQNNGWIAGGVEAAISTIIGTGLQLNATPDHEAIGMTASEAAKWARRVERRYEARCRNAFECDAGGRWTAGQMEAAHLRQFFATGEGITQFLMFSRPGVESRTRARLLPSHWLCRDTDVSERLHQGVRLDRHGAPVSYRFRLKDGNGITSDVEYRARDRFGRPIIKHIFDGLPGQHRGITVFAPVLKTIQNYDRLSGSTLAASFLHAMFAATIESDYPTEDVLSAIGGRDAHDRLHERIDRVA